ncbi:TetR family transcriptional regulator [Pseudomonas aeruginosa]|nr:TetR family transcriptional regulator [Pseudomonas aeruginosa]
MARKPRAEMIEETRAKLIDAARRAFADNGYAGASMDELTASAGLTRGALYHHFGDKKGLLAAVVQQIDDEMNLRLGAILAAGEDLWSGFRAYNRAYLEMALEAEIQRIVLRDAPAILGSPSSEASQLRCLSSMTGQLRELMDSGRVRRTDAEALAWLLNGALVDAALRIANAEHPPESLARAYSVFANDGKLVPLSLLRDNPQNQVRQAMDPQIARRIRAMLQTVVEDPKGVVRARVPGYHVAGKSGTARKASGRGYADKSYRSLFVGMAPASDPQLVLAVMIDSPTRIGYFGGLVSAPTFSDIMAGSLRALATPPDNLQDSPAVADRQHHG